MPSVSAVDPDEVVKKHRIGRVAGSLDELAEAIKAMIESPEQRRKLGLRARDYVVRNHGPEQTYEPLAALLDDVIAGNVSRASRAEVAHS